MPPIEQKKSFTWTNEYHEVFMEALNLCGGVVYARPKDVRTTIFYSTFVHSLPSKKLI